MERVIIYGGRRQGRSLSNEATMRRALAEGKEVVTGPRNGVYFSVTLEGDAIRYVPYERRPDWIPAPPSSDRERR